MSLVVLAVQHDVFLMDFLSAIKRGGGTVSGVILESKRRTKLSDSELSQVRNHSEYKRRILWWSASYWLRLIVKLLKKSVARGLRQESFIQEYRVPMHSSLDTVHLLNSLKAEFIILYSSQWLIKPILLESGIPIINVHNALLPYYRGLDALFWSLYYSDKSVYHLTAHLVDEGIDTGPIICSREYKIQTFISLLSLRDESLKRKADVFIDALNLMAEGDFEMKAQSGGTNFGPMPLATMEALHNEMKFKYGRVKD